MMVAKFSTTFAVFGSLPTKSSMKNYKLQLILFVFLMGFLGGCGSYRVFTGNIQYDASKRNDIIKSDELNSYLVSRNQIKFVLRTPPGFEDFSEDEKLEWNQVFGQIEKELILQGHIVKDRVLLNQLLENGDMSLTEVGKAMNTDIIIELINIEFDITNQVKNFAIREKRLNTNFSSWNNIDFVDCRMAMMECRITLVEVGNVGGIFKFYVSGCDAGNDFFIKVYEHWDGELDQERDAYVGWNYDNVAFKSLTHTYSMNDLAQNKAIERLVASLLKELSPGDNSSN